MVGFGITPEGINQNYIMYEFALEMGWIMKTQNLNQWCNKYSTARYGTEISDQIGIAWNTLAATVYNYKGAQQMRGKYIYNRRPSMNLQPWVCMCDKHNCYYFLS